MNKVLRGEVPSLILIFVFSLLFLSIGLDKVGEHWDEVTVASVGESYLGFIKNEDFSQSSWELNHEHPPVAKYIYGTARFLTKNIPILQDKSGYYPEGRDFLFARFFSVVMSSLTVLVLFMIGFQISKSRLVAGLVALLLFINPVFQSYARIVSLEVPLLLFGSLFVLYSLKYASKKSLKNYFAVVISFALLVGTRYNGLLLLPFFYILQLHYLSNNSNWTNLSNLKSLIMPVLSGVLLIIIWPYLWSSPVSGVLASADRGLEVHTREYFLGKLGNAPWFYYISYLLVKTPLTLLALFIFGIVGGFKKTKQVVVFALLLFLLPFTASFLPLKQDGLRYVNLYLIGFSVICAFGVIGVIGVIRSMGIKIVILASTFLLLIISLTNHFPNYLDYYNYFIPVVDIYSKRLFEIGGWGEGVLEAVKKLPKPQDGQTSKVYFAISPVHIIPNLPDGFIETGDFSQADFVLINTNYRWYDGLVSNSDLERFTVIKRITVGNFIELVSVYQKLPI